MRRLALAILVAILTFSASGVAALAIPEPCTGTEQAASDEGMCPPTCVTCGCCAQAAEPLIVVLARSFEVPVSIVTLPNPRLSKVSPRDILHVPKLHTV